MSDYLERLRQRVEKGGNPMITDVDTALKDIADWYIGKRREITEPELESILMKHCGTEAEVKKFVGFLETEPGQLRFKTLLRERKGGGTLSEATEEIEYYKNYRATVAKAPEGSGNPEGYYLGGWKPGDIAIYNDFGLRSLYVVQIMEWREELGERYGTLVKDPLYLPPVMHDRRLGSVRGKVIDTTLVDWDFSWYGKVEEWNKVGTIHYYHYTNLDRNVLDLIRHQARTTYPEVQQRIVSNLMSHPGWEVLKRYGLVEPVKLTELEELWKLQKS